MKYHTIQNFVILRKLADNNFILVLQCILFLDKRFHQIKLICLNFSCQNFASYTIHATYQYGVPSSTPQPRILMACPPR